MTLSDEGTVNDARERDEYLDCEMPTDGLMEVKRSKEPSM